MTVVQVTPPSDVTFAWDPDTHAGYPNGNGRIVSIEIPATSTTASEPSMTYVFPYVPVEAEASNISMEYVEIDRPGRTKLIGSRGPQLVRISFRFMVADRPSGGVLSVDDELHFLSKMASRNSPVAFAGLGTFFAKTPGAEAYRLWRVVDMSYAIRRRDALGAVTQAEVSMTVSEDHNPDLATILLPRIAYKPYVIKKSKGKKKAAKPTSPDPDDDNSGSGGYTIVPDIP